MSWQLASCQLQNKLFNYSKFDISNQSEHILEHIHLSWYDILGNATVFASSIFNERLKIHKQEQDKKLEWHKPKPQIRIEFHIIHGNCLFLFLFWFHGIFLGEVIYTAATTKPSAMPTSSLLRSSLSVNSRHHQRTTSGMTSSSSATSSNSNNINNERHRDNNSRSSELQKPSGAGIAFGESREDDSPKDGPLNRLHAQNGKFITSYKFSSKIQNI